MAQIDYSKTTFEGDEPNNVSQPNMLASAGGGKSVFLFGVSKLGDGSVCTNRFDGYIGTKGAGATLSSNNDYEFPTPITFTVYALDDKPITSLTINFDSVVNQFATRLRIDGKDYTNDDTRLQVTLEPINPHTIEFIAWNVALYPLRVTSILVSGDGYINEPILIGKSSSSLIDVTHLFKKWDIYNKIKAVDEIRESLDATTILDGDAYYKPELSFTLHDIVQPEDFAQFVQIVNRKTGFICQIHDGEILEVVKRWFKLNSHQRDELLKHKGRYLGAIRPKFTAQSVLSYDTVNDEGEDIGYDDLIAKALNDSRLP
jgi:hypothetical protein